MKKIYIAFVAVFCLSFAFHKHYVSLCEIEYVKEKEALQIIVSLFTDDLEYSIRKEKNSDFQIDKNESSTDSICYKYLKTHLKINANGNYKNYNYVGKELTNNKVFFYLEATDIKHLTSLKIENTLLVKQFKGQQNIVKLKIKNKHRSFYLNRKTTSANYKI